MNATAPRLRALLLPLALAAPLATLAQAPDNALDGAPDGAHDCLIEPRTVADVGSSREGVIARLLVDRGDTVARDQPIAELESGIEQAVVDQAAARAEMEGEVITRQVDLELARLDSERFDELHRQRLAPAQQRDEASARERVASAALVQALENRRLLELELAHARRLLAQRTVRSPVDGVVVRRLAFPGELVYDNPIMTIAELDPLRVEVVLPGRLFGSVGVGDRAGVFGELSGGEPLPATVAVVDPLLDTGSGTFGVRLHLPNPDRAIVAGQRCRVAFAGGAQTAGEDEDTATIRHARGRAASARVGLGAARLSTRPR